MYQRPCRQPTLRPASISFDFDQGPCRRGDAKNVGFASAHSQANAYKQYDRCVMACSRWLRRHAKLESEVGTHLGNAEVSMTARIGLIIPSSNRMVEEEMVRHVPPGVTAHVARLRMTGAHRVSLDALLPQVKETAATLIDARCDVVAFHCTANSTSEGLAGEAKLLGALRDAGATHVTQTARAIRHAFGVLGARRLVVLA